MEWDIKIKKLCKDGRYCNMLLHAGGNNPLENEKVMTEDGRAGVRTYLVRRRKARTLNIGGEMSFRQTVLQKEKK